MAEIFKKISSEKAPKAIGPYSQAIQVNNFIYCSGMLPVDPITGEMPETIQAQTHQIGKNITNLLLEAGSSIENVFKVTCFLKDINDFSAMNEVYAEYFTSKPARSAVAVRDIPKGALLEIEVIAYIGN